MPHGDARRHPRCEGRAQVIAVEAVIAHQHDGSVRTRELHQSSQQQIVEAVGAVHHVFVEGKVSFRCTRHLRRVIGHELVANLVDGAVIDGCEVPVRAVLHQPAGGGVHAAGFGQSLRQMPEALVFGLVNAGCLRHEQTQHFIGIDVPGTDAAFIEVLGQVFRPIRARRRLRPVFRRVFFAMFETVVQVRDQTTLRGLFPLRRKPAHHVRFQPAFSQHLPHRLAASGRGRNRHHLACLIHLGKAWHAVMVGMFARGDAGPQHRRKLRVQRR